MIKILGFQIKKGNKKIGLIYKSGSNDQTLSNWKRIFGKQNLSTINDGGIPLSSVEEINEMWDKINNLVTGEVESRTNA